MKKTGLYLVERIGGGVLAVALVGLAGVGAAGGLAVTPATSVAMARGVVVSRSSPGTTRFSVGSKRSRRVTASPA